VTAPTDPPAEEPFRSGLSAEEVASLRGLLLALGATDDEADAAIASGQGGALALDLTLRAAPPRSLDDAAAELDVDRDEFVRYWHALGFGAATVGGGGVPADVLAALPLVTGAVAEWLGEETSLGLARVIGATSGRIAEALVDAFRIDYEVPQLTSGTSYTQVVQTYLDITRESLPAFDALLTAVLRAHLVRVAAGHWAPDADRQAARRDLFVGFVDLVGYTALSRTLSTGELSRLLRSFEDVVIAAVSTRNGRLVKLIGDGAMFVTDTAADGCLIALDLLDRLAAVETLPPARIGADCGAVLSLAGDYFGDVVNRAARLVALALPGTVVVSDQVAAALADAPAHGLVADRLPDQALKGFRAPAASYRIVRPESAP
jgi:class 3 adenylate cyclase